MKNAKQEQKFDLITNSIIELIKDDLSGKYQKGWIDRMNFRPSLNPVTNRLYSGINALYLSIVQTACKYSSNHWMTFKQAKNVGANVKKGSKSVDVTYTDVFYKLDGKSISKEQYNKLSDDIKKKVNVHFYQKWYKVFNTDQIENLDSKYLPSMEVVEEVPGAKKIDRIENIVASLGVNIEHFGNRAYYTLGLDKIVMPEMEQFVSTNDYYATLLHEIGHWTGHKSRLDRDLENGFGSPEYAFEELVAELGSIFTMSSLGLNPNKVNGSAYLQSWLRALESDNKFIFKASAKAQKIERYIMEHDCLELKNVA